VGPRHHLSGVTLAPTVTRTDLARVIEHTLLRPEATGQEIEQACQVATSNGCPAVVVNPSRVALAARLLAGTGVEVVATVGFPFGAARSEMKVLEARLALADGADVIDVVIDIGLLKDGDLRAVEQELAAVVREVGTHPVKVIIETALLTDDEKRTACQLAVEAGAAYVKTSTGFSAGGATVHDITLMRAAVGDRARIKAAGGIRYYEDALALLNAGADRLGVSRTQALLASAPA
jgi:deoxyribose-phosphate aldolase